jgi:hypothetical protein
VPALPDFLPPEGPLLAAWDRSSDTVVFYACRTFLGQLGHARVAAADRPAFEQRLRRRGVRIGSTDAISPFAWSDDGGFTVWSLDGGVVADGADGTLRVGEMAIDRPAVLRVVSFLYPDEWSCRGVRIELRDGFWYTVAMEDDGVARWDPAYGIDNLIIDAAWATYLGRDLSRWLGVPHVDELP